VIFGGIVFELSSLYGLPVELCACLVVYSDFWLDVFALSSL